MLVDYHTHTPLCRHATGEPREYVEQAIRRGLDGIGFSDHSPMPEWYDPNCRMKASEFVSYREQVLRLRQEYGSRLVVRFGIEADFFPGTEEYVRAFLSAAEFDYVIGSVHYIGSWGFDNPDFVEEWSRRDVDEVYAEYYRAIEQMAASGLFDIVGHLDVVKKFGHRPRREPEPYLSRALEAIADAGMCIELNTSGLRKPCREMYPSPALLSRAAARGIPVIVGSDAHRPHDVGADFDRALELLRSAGIRETAHFEARRRSAFPLT